MAAKSDELVIVHIKAEPTPCRTCGSSSVITIRMSHEDSPLWVQMCSECDDRKWSLDGEASSD
jgi:hypothetical protein